MMDDKVALVTGANAGMGKIIATELARQGATVVMVARSRRRGEEAMSEIASTLGNASLDLLVADLSSQQAVRRLADEFLQRYSHLHVLVNNAGVHLQKRQMSVDGIEMHLAVNHLAGFLLTNLLVDIMRASTPARIVNVTSKLMTRSIKLDDLQSEQTFRPWEVYGQSKLAVALCTYALARRLTGTGITVNVLHPGVVATDIIDDAVLPIARPFLSIFKRFLLTPEQGAQTALYLATSPELESVTGKYFVRGKQRQSVPISYDEALQERVWTMSTDLVGLEHSSRNTVLSVAWIVSCGLEESGPCCSSDMEYHSSKIGQISTTRWAGWWSGHVLASCNASSRSATSITAYPPMTSVPSRNGPSVTSG